MEWLKVAINAVPDISLASSEAITRNSEIDDDMSEKCNNSLTTPLTAAYSNGVNGADGIHHHQSQHTTHWRASPPPSPPPNHRTVGLHSAFLPGYGPIRSSLRLRRAIKWNDKHRLVVSYAQTQICLKRCHNAFNPLSLVPDSRYKPNVLFLFLRILAKNRILCALYSQVGLELYSALPDIWVRVSDQWLGSGTTKANWIWLSFAWIHINILVSVAFHVLSSIKLRLDECKHLFRQIYRI